MKKRNLVFVMSLLAISAGLLTAVVAEPGYISVSSSVSKEVEPDVASLRFSVEKTAKTPDEASEKNKDTISKVLDAVKAELNPETDTIKTASFSVEPEYYWENNKQHLKGYKASNTVVVVVSTDLEKLGKIMNAALQNGATRVDGLNFTLKDTNKYCANLLAEAAAETKVKAYTVAKALGTSVVGVKTINTSCSTQEYDRHIRYYAASAKIADGAVNESSPVPIEQGKMKIYASVNADYNLK